MSDAFAPHARVAIGVVNDSPGFSTGSASLAGFDIDLMNFIGTKLDVRVTPKILTVGERDAAVVHGDVDLVIATYSITSGRNAEGIDFAGPYMRTDQAFLIRMDEQIATPADLVGKRICTVSTATSSHVSIPGAIFDKLADTNADCVSKLRSKEVDAVFTDTLILDGFMQQANSEGVLKVVMPGIYGNTQNYGVGMQGGDHADCLRINAIIQQYLQTQWTTDFNNELPYAVQTHLGTNTTIGNFENEFKPDDTNMSCTVNTAPSAAATSR